MELPPPSKTSKTGEPWSDFYSNAVQTSRPVVAPAVFTGASLTVPNAKPLHCYLGLQGSERKCVLIDAKNVFAAQVTSKIPSHLSCYSSGKATA